MKVLGITGGVGAGKSTVLTYLSEKYHARVIQADQVAHLLQEPGQVCYEQMIEYFGREILNEDQSISREKLGGQVFSDPEKLAALNAMIHPQVKEYIKKEIQKEQEKGEVPFVVVEAALLLEDHYEVICDEIWYVHTADEIRKERLMASRGYSEKKVQEIMKNQLLEEMFRKGSQFVVDNSGDFVQNTYKQIDKGLVEHGFL